MCHWKERCKARGSGGLCLSPIPGIANPAECFCRGSHSTGTSAGFLVFIGKKILSFISSAK